MYYDISHDCITGKHHYITNYWPRPGEESPDWLAEHWTLDPTKGASVIAMFCRKISFVGIDDPNRGSRFRGETLYKTCSAAKCSCAR